MASATFEEHPTDPDKMILRKPHLDIEGPLHVVCRCDKCKAEKQEPVGRFAKFTDGIWREVAEGSAGVPLYTTPKQRTWVGLTVDEILSALESVDPETKRLPKGLADFAYAVEAKLKEKNNG